MDSSLTIIVICFEIDALSFIEYDRDYGSVHLEGEAFEGGVFTENLFKDELKCELLTVFCTRSCTCPGCYQARYQTQRVGQCMNWAENMLINWIHIFPSNRLCTTSVI